MSFYFAGDYDLLAAASYIYGTAGCHAMSGSIARRDESTSKFKDTPGPGRSSSK